LHATKIVSFQYLDEDKIDLDYKCAICLCPLFEPVSSIKCGHSFCKSCAVNLKKCPTCVIDTLPSDYIDSPIIIKKFVNSLKVYCPRCNSIFERSQLPEHINDCPYLCENNCGITISPIYKKNHEDNECPNVIVVCGAKDLFCDWSGKRSELNEHQIKCTFLLQSTIINAFKQQLLLQKQENELQQKKIQNQMETEISELKKQIIKLQKELNDISPFVSCLNAEGQVWILAMSSKNIWITNTYESLVHNTSYNVGAETEDFGNSWVQASFNHRVKVRSVKIAALITSFTESSLTNGSIFQYYNDITWIDIFKIEGVKDLEIKVFTLQKPIVAQFWRLYRARGNVALSRFIFN